MHKHVECKNNIEVYIKYYYLIKKVEFLIGFHPRQTAYSTGNHKLRKLVILSRMNT